MTLLRLLGGVVWLAVGVASAVAGVVTHDLWWGLPLTTAALAATMLAAGRGWVTRLPLALGFAVATGVATPTRPEGDFLIGGNVRGYLLLGLACLSVLGAVATLPRPGRGPRRATAAPGPGMAQPGSAGSDTYTRERDGTGA